MVQQKYQAAIDKQAGILMDERKKYLEQLKALQEDAVSSQNKLLLLESKQSQETANKVQEVKSELEELRKAKD